MLIVGSVLGGWHRIAIWALAAAIDYAGPAWLTRERLPRGRGFRDREGGDPADLH